MNPEAKGEAEMKIGIIGSGNIGAAAARLFARAGHEVAVSNSRGGAGLETLIAELGGRARATGIEEAARFGEVVLVAVPFGRYETLPPEAFAGKVVIDAGNYYPQRDGNFAQLDGGGATSSELVAAHLKDARLVKEIGFAAVDTGPLGEGGRRQQVGTPVYNKELNAREAAQVLSAG